MVWCKKLIWGKKKAGEQKEWFAGFYKIHIKGCDETPNDRI